MRIATSCSTWTTGGPLNQLEHVLIDRCHRHSLWRSAVGLAWLLSRPRAGFSFAQQVAVETFLKALLPLPQQPDS
jgi:hypothetical protein